MMRYEPVCLQRQEIKDEFIEKISFVNIKQYGFLKQYEVKVKNENHFCVHPSSFIIHHFLMLVYLNEIAIFATSY
jgi:hypothetical protein